MVKFDTIPLDGEVVIPSARLPIRSAFAPGGRCNSYSCDIGAPRPTCSRVTMTGSRFPGSRVSDHLPGDLSVPQWYLWSSTNRLQLRGQRGIAYLNTRTA